MGFITRYGSFWGMIPQTSGRVIWVAAGDTYTVEGRSYSASNNNDGLSPERAVRTVTYAVSLTTANVGDVIVLLPGDHTVAAAVSVNVAGITITGMPGSYPLHGGRMPGVGPRAKTTITGTASSVFSLAAADIEICFMTVLAISAQTSINVPSTATRAYLHDLTVDMRVAGSTSTIGILLGNDGLTGPVVDTHIRNCYFIASGAQGGVIEATGTSQGAIIENITVQQAYSTTVWANAILFGSGVHYNVCFRDIDVFSGNTMASSITDAIDCVSATGDQTIAAYRIIIPPNAVFNVAAATDAALAQAFIATAGGGAGSNLAPA